MVPLEDIHVDDPEPSADDTDIEEEDADQQVSARNREASTP